MARGGPELHERNLPNTVPGCGGPTISVELAPLLPPSGRRGLGPPLTRVGRLGVRGGSSGGISELVLLRDSLRWLRGVSSSREKNTHVIDLDIGIKTSDNTFRELYTFDAKVYPVQERGRSFLVVAGVGHRHSFLSVIFTTLTQALILIQTMTHKGLSYSECYRPFMSLHALYEATGPL